MALKEMAATVAGWRIEIVATDLSTEVLEKAKAGIYSQFEVQRGLPIRLLIKYFTQIGDTWQIAPEIRAHGAVPAAQSAQRFRPSRHVRHGVLPQRADLFRPGHQDRRARAHRARRPSATAIWSLGAAETVVGLTDCFQPVADKRGLYAPNQSCSQIYSRRAVAAPRGGEQRTVT